MPCFFKQRGPWGATRSTTCPVPPDSFTKVPSSTSTYTPRPLADAQRSTHRFGRLALVAREHRHVDTEGLQRGNRCLGVLAQLVFQAWSGDRFEGFSN